MCNDAPGATMTKRFTPEPMRKIKDGEIEVRKGLGESTRWFYVSSVSDMKTLVRLCRGWGFAAGATYNRSGSHIKGLWYTRHTAE